MRIALDAMGGDDAPASIVAGAVRAARELPHEILLVGDVARLERELSRYPKRPATITLKAASEVVEMHESPASSVRKKRDASINVAAQLVKDAQAHAMVSAGNTGATVASAVLRLGLL